MEKHSRDLKIGSRSLNTSGGETNDVLLIDTRYVYSKHPLHYCEFVVCSMLVTSIMTWNNMFHFQNSNEIKTESKLCVNDIRNSRWLNNFVALHSRNMSGTQLRWKLLGLCAKVVWMRSNFLLCLTYQWNQIIAQQMFV